jgi:hypothetical protein
MISRACVLLLAASTMFAQAKPASRAGLAGLVRDSLGLPVKRASVMADSGKGIATTDDSGHFDLRGLPSGQIGFTVLKIGYAPVSFVASLPSDSLVVVSITLRHAQMLDPVSVNAARVSERLARTGYFDRQRTGLGSYLSPAKIDSLAPNITQPTQFLRDVRGIDIRCVRGGCAPVAHGRANCLWLYVDGANFGDARQLDSLGLTPSGFAAIEVYDRSTQVPLEFQSAPPIKTANGRGAMSQMAGCGAIVVWTKTHIPDR